MALGVSLRRRRCIHCSLNSASPSYYRRYKYHHRGSVPLYVPVRAYVRERGSRGNAWAPHNGSGDIERACGERATKKSIYHFRTSRAHIKQLVGAIIALLARKHVPACVRVLSTDGLPARSDAIVPEDLVGEFRAEGFSGSLRRILRADFRTLSSSTFYTRLHATSHRLLLFFFFKSPVAHKSPSLSSFPTGVCLPKSTGGRSLFHGHTRSAPMLRIFDCQLNAENPWRCKPRSRRMIGIANR